MPRRTPRPSDFHWTPQPQAEALVRRLLDEFLQRCAPAQQLAQRMAAQTGSRLIDWLDHLAVPRTDTLEQELATAGFEASPTAGAEGRFVHRGGIFPAILLESGGPAGAAVRVESVADFLATHQLEITIAGRPTDLYRLARIHQCEQAELWVVERHGYNGFVVPEISLEKGVARMEHLEHFRIRRRSIENPADGFAHLRRLIIAAVTELGPAVAADAFFRAERGYWQRRNDAAQVQKGRQDRLGLGWANHDHHTYRCSREYFHKLVELFELLGLVCRERFYAGAQAGWGAQVMEQPEAKIVVFADVDLSPDELSEDFAHHPLQPRHELGTVGLWCALHGESILQAGMHHLECQFDFDALRQQLAAEAGIQTMKPFTDLPYLRQAFTAGQRWPVDPRRIDALLQRGQITREQADTFRREGAIGSHLENLQRDQGFKGFNQEGVSQIITATDPRRGGRG